eukprot:CAMPEP_0119190418 /NCGR_PEP_ID=MMETSP1316-20130426/1506_1 /TAXON_ID=41880 /ORGANISM="Pycnococcus provasolii, Strain RCC2336" /LENGTH=46 /DNA_ID= /DNA_START= /DNA_END= /DNA_ORIENTATION=
MAPCEPSSNLSFHEPHESSHVPLLKSPLGPRTARGAAAAAGGGGLV